jgi:hypothetical protein
MQESEMNKDAFNMATAQKIFRTFGGNDNEDVSVWIRDVLLVAEVCQMNEKDVIKGMIMSLRDGALSWASQILSGRTNMLTLNDIISLIKKRFGVQKRTEMTLSRFLAAEHPRSRSEFSELLRDGTWIHEKNMMNNTALAQMIVNKSPIEIKALLYQTASMVNTWDEFVQKAEEVAWIAFPDKELSRVEHESNKTHHYKTTKRSSEKYCILHGKGSHSTKECKKFTEVLSKERLVARGRKTEVNRAETELEKTKEEEKNEFGFIYSFSSSYGNPFFIDCKIGNKIYKALIDTGADVSLIPYEYIIQTNIYINMMVL